MLLKCFITTVLFPPGDFLKPEQPVYEDILNFAELKKYMENQLEDYNMEPGIIPMELVLFRDAIEHGKSFINIFYYLIVKENDSKLCLFTVCRIVRVIRQPRGNMLLVGVGGSGRQSLSRLASYLISYKVFQIEVTRLYRLQEFREGLSLVIGKSL